jgi:hypothetical protein
MCCGLLNVHSHMGTETNAYLNHQWYDHTNIVKRWTIIGCGKPKRVRNVVKKWADDKQNAGVVRQTNNQVHTLHLHMNREMSKDVFVWYLKERLLKGKQIPTHVSNSLKKHTILVKIEPLGFQKVEHKNRHIRVTWFIHFIMPSKMRKCQYQHMLLHLEKQGDHPTENKWQVQEQSMPNTPRMGE